MGACYSVNLNITLRNETAAIKAMQEYIKKEQFHSFTLTDNIIKVINYEKMSKLYDFDII